MTFDDTNEEYYLEPIDTDAAWWGIGGKICPWCNVRPLAKRKGSSSCGDSECRKVQARTRMRIKRQTPEYKERERLYRQTETAKKHARENSRKRRADPIIHARELDMRRARRTDESRAKGRDYMRARRADPDFKKLEYERRNSPEGKAKAKEYELTEGRQAYYQQRRQTPRYIAYQYQYLRSEGFKERSRVRGRQRGKPYPRGWGGPKRRWDTQRHQCAYGWSEFDGHSYRSVGKNFETDHLVPLALLKAIGITDKNVRNTIDNIWLITIEKNRGALRGKHDKPFHHWLAAIGEPKPVVEMGRAWYEHTVNIIVAQQQAIDPSYELTEERRKILGLTA